MVNFENNYELLQPNTSPQKARLTPHIRRAPAQVSQNILTNADYCEQVSMIHYNYW